MYISRFGCIRYIPGFPRMLINPLGIKDVYMGAHQNRAILHDFNKEKNIPLENMLFMGDDIPDVEAMNLVRLGCCPNDAVPEVLAAADYISHKDGGKGCVRDVIEQVLKVQGKWGTLTNARNDSK